MNNFTFAETRLIISTSSKNNSNLSYLQFTQQNSKILSHRLNLIKTLKIYIKKYCFYAPNRYNILYLSILYLDIILSKNKISLSYDKNLKYLCLCCFLLSLKFTGNYDISKKIIKNFCHNYREEYKIFEMQCLILLDYNLLYTTSYDYLNMILIKQHKKLLSICSSLLYQICEDNLYINYSPFYISIAIVQIAKASINDKNYNHYDKYFHDQRVKYLYKMFSSLINPKPNLNEINADNNNNYFEKTNNMKYMNNFDNTNYYSHNRNINSSNINIFTNNNIQNNIVIINEYASKKNEASSKNNNNFVNNEFDVNRRTFFTTKNKTPIKIFVNRQTDTNKNNYINDNEIYEYKYCEKKITTGGKRTSLSKSYYNKEEIKNNYNHSNYRITKLKDNKNTRPTYKISYYLKSSNNLNYFSNNYNQNTFQTKRKNNKEYKNGQLLNDIIILQDQNKSYSSIKRKMIYPNKSLLNFQLVSGVSKEKLVKLSRNLSKILIKPSEVNS